MVLVPFRAANHRIIRELNKREISVLIVELRHLQRNFCIA